MIAPPTPIPGEAGQCQVTCPRILFQLNSRERSNPRSPAAAHVLDSRPPGWAAPHVGMALHCSGPDSPFQPRGGLLKSISKTKIGFRILKHSVILEIRESRPTFHPRTGRHRRLAAHAAAEADTPHAPDLLVPGQPGWPLWKAIWQFHSTSQNTNARRAPLTYPLRSWRARLRLTCKGAERFCVAALFANAELEPTPMSIAGEQSVSSSSPEPELSVARERGHSP